MSIVLFDSSSSSVKALEAGCAQSFFVQHNRDQLVVLHAMPPTAASQATASAANAANLAASGTAGRGSVAAAVASGESSDGGAGGSSSGANTAAAVANSVASIAQVVDNIHKNRFASSSLNYKLETFRVSSTMPQVLAVQRAAAEQLAKEQAAAAETQAPTAATGNKGGRQQHHSSAASNAATAAAAAASTNNTGGDQQQEAPTVQMCFAENVAVRAAHHMARTVLLGVGSSGGHGKALVLGGIARAVIDRLRRSREVDCVGIFKPSGPPVRSTQPMRVVVVATPATTVDAVASALGRIPNLSAARGDFVGLMVVMNAARPKPKSLVEALAALEQQRQQQAALGMQQGQVPPPTSQEQLAMIKVDEEGEENGAFWRKTVEATLKLAGDVSKLGFMNQEERQQQLLQMEQEEDAGPNSGRSGGSPGGGGAAAAASPQVAPSVALSATVATTSAGFEGPHLLSTFWIEPTNRDPAPDLEAHTGYAQLAKAAAGLKADYCAVLADSEVGPNATNSLLSVVRPHILLV